MQDAPPETGQSSTRTNGPDDVTRLVTPPAITMIVLASLSLLYRTVETLFRPTAKLLRELAHEADIHFHPDSEVWGVLSLTGDLFRYAINAVVLLGAVMMLRQRSWPLSLAAAILISIPCLGPCCPFGIPVGIWALVVLLRPEVRAALERNG